MNFKKKKQEVDENETSFNHEELEQELQQKSTEELLELILTQLKQINHNTAASSRGSSRPKRAEEEEAFTVKAKIGDVEDKGKFARIKIMTTPPKWVSCWDPDIAAFVYDAFENEETITADLIKKGEYTNIVGAR